MLQLGGGVTGVDAGAGVHGVIILNVDDNGALSSLHFRSTTKWPLRATLSAWAPAPMGVAITTSAMPWCGAATIDSFNTCVNPPSGGF